MKATILTMLLVSMAAFLLVFAGCQRSGTEVEPTADVPQQNTITTTLPCGKVVPLGSDNATAEVLECDTIMVGCTRTQGYWKTHSEFGPARYDDTWAQVPGGQGARSPFFQLGRTWIQVFWTPPMGGNAYYILVHQFMATALNWRSGASMPADVVGALLHAASLLNMYDGTPIR